MGPVVYLARSHDGQSALQNVVNSICNLLILSIPIGHITQSYVNSPSPPGSAIIFFLKRFTSMDDVNR